MLTFVGWGLFLGFSGMVGYAMFADQIKCWGVAKVADAPGCFPGGEFVKAHLGGSNPSPPAIFP